MSFKKGDKIRLKNSFVQSYGHVEWVKTLAGKTLTVMKNNSNT